MNNSLLIHNDNIGYVDMFSNSLKFKANFSDIDKYISLSIIQKEIATNDYDVIYIKDNLSSNYLELYGLRLAYHIRLSKELGDKRFLPLVIISDIDSYALHKVSSMAKILFTQNTFIVKNDKKTVEGLSIRPFNNFSENVFLNQIEISAPKDYLSHHSITNEWAIDQWAYFLGVNTPTIENNRNKISSMLYYKYLKAVYHLENKSLNTQTKAKEHTGTILLLDDKFNKGWEDIIHSYCSKYYTDVTLKVVDDITKESTVQSIQKSLEKRVIELNPDIIILDLRLLDSDGDDKQAINKISGIQVLKYIKKLNPSLQVIMFTASSDSLILDELYNNKILGYVKKDSPSDKYSASKNSFKKLDTLIKIGLKRRYLKDIYSNQQKLLNTLFLSNSEGQEILNIRKDVQSVFDLTNSNLEEPFKYAMLAIYRCVELICDYYIHDSYNNASWKSEKNKFSFDNNEDNSTRNYIFNIIKYRTDLDIIDYEDDIKGIVCSRNYAIHPKERPKCISYVVKNPNHENIVRWFELLFNIVNHIQ